MPCQPDWNPQRIATSSPGNSRAWGLAWFYCAVLCGSVLDFQSPISSYSQIDPQCRLCQIRQRLLPPQSPKPGLKIVVSEQVERQLASLPTSQCMLCPSESGHPGQPAPVWGSSFSLCLPLHNFQWALCNWCCAAGAGAGAVLVLRGPWYCLLLAAGPSLLLLALALALSSLPRFRLLQFRSRHAAPIVTARTSQETSRP